MECAAVGWGLDLDDGRGEGLGKMERHQRGKEQRFQHASLEGKGCQPGSRKGIGEATEGRRGLADCQLVEINESRIQEIAIDWIRLLVPALPCAFAALFMLDKRTVLCFELHQLGRLRQKGCSPTDASFLSFVAPADLSGLRLDRATSIGLRPDEIMALKPQEILSPCEVAR